ncbi:MAG: flagellar hook protein FlgE [Candidatus Methylomirabilia bacterium]
MSVLTTGVTGLRTHQQAIDVIGANIANINTPGYKGAKPLFSDLLSQTLRGETVPFGVAGGTNAQQIGLGVQLGAIQIGFNQAAVDTTGNPTDLAIQGSGLFILKDNNGALHYSRAGNFTTDATGILVDTITGFRVQGANGDITIQGQTVPGTATTTNVFSGNLDAGVADGTTHVATFTVNDSLGAAHVLTITFTKNFGAAAGQWDFTVTETDANIASLAGASGSVTFDALGAITAGATAPLTINYAAAAGVTTPQVVTLDFGSATNTRAVTGFAGASTLYLSSQDGNRSGTLQSVTVGTNGTVSGFYDNGTRQTLDTIQLATFANSGGLIREGTNLFRTSGNSGIPNVGTPATGGRGALIAGALEQSNVDLSEQFSNLISTQRGFEASARLIRTGDELLQTVVNLKQ